MLPFYFPIPECYQNPNVLTFVKFLMSNVQAPMTIEAPSPNDKDKSIAVALFFALRGKYREYPPQKNPNVATAFGIWLLGFQWALGIWLLVIL